jgi:sodium transport system permease protein
MAKFGITVGSLALVAFLLTTLITKAFNSERVMFNA